MEWRVYDTKSNDLISPRKYSTGKTQLDICNEIKEHIDRIQKDVKFIKIPKVNRYREEKKVPFVICKGGAGSGKSLIALNIAKEYKKVIIVVPKKNLQEQYLKDYYGSSAKMQIMKEDNTPLKIATLKGKGNFPCKFQNCNADAEYLPCNRPLKENEKRIDVAEICEDWSPFSPIIQGHKIGNEFYPLTDNIQSIECTIKPFYYHDRGNCQYYNQFKEIGNADVIIYNSNMFEINLAMGRIPKVDLIIFDEIDYYLDGLKNEFEFNPDYYISKVDNLIIPEKEKKTLKDNFSILKRIIEETPQNKIDKPSIITSEIYGALCSVCKEYLRESKYFKTLYNSIKKYQKHTSFCHYAITKTKKDNRTIYKMKLFILEVKEIVKSLKGSFPAFVGLSYTIHNKSLLGGMYGLYGDTTPIVESEKMTGEMVVARTNQEYICNYNFLNSLHGKRLYHLSLNKIMEYCKGRQTLFHVVSYGDFPQKSIGTLPSISELKQTIQSDNNGRMLIDFKEGKIQTLFSTKDMRGTDLPDEKCECIIIPKLPYPNMKDPFLIALKEKGEGLFWMYYKDKMIRELWQSVTRGVRHNNDSVCIYSPDKRVFDVLLDTFSLYGGNLKKARINHYGRNNN